MMLHLGTTGLAQALGLFALIQRSRRWGVQVTGEASGASPCPTPEFEGLQFPLRDVVLWTTVSSLSFGVFYRVSRPHFYGLPLPNLIIAFWVGTSLAIVAFVAFWAMLGRRSLWVSLPFLVVVSPLAGSVAALPSSFAYALSTPEPIWYSCLSCLESVFVVGSLFVFRIHGYQLIRPKSSPAELEPVADSV